MPRAQGLVRTVTESEGAVEESRAPAPPPASALLRASAELSDRDVRSKRPPQLSFLLRLDTLRRLARVVILLSLDFVGIFLAIFTALCVKAELRTSLDVASVFHQTKDTVSFAYLVTVLLFARSSLYSDRALDRDSRGSWHRSSRSPASRWSSRSPTAGRSRRSTSSTGPCCSR